MTERLIWDAGTGVEQLDDLIEENVKEAIKDYLSELHGYFPNTWYPTDGGRDRKLPPDKVLTFRIYAEGLEAEDKDFDLEELLMEDISQCYEDGSYLEGLQRMAPALTRLAKLANQVIKVREEEGEKARLDWSPNVAKVLLGGET